MNHNRMRLTTVLILVTVVIATMSFGTFASSHTTDDGETQSVTYLRVAHLSPDAPAVDVFLDNESVATNATFGDVTDYLAVEPGTHTVTIVTAGNNSSVVLEENVTVEPRSVLTVAAAGEVATDATSTFGLRVFADNALEPSPNSSALRIVHLSPDAGAVTLTVDNGSTTLVENLSNGEAVDYQTLAPGDYQIEIRRANGNGNGTLLATVNVSVGAGQATTAWAIGYVVPLNGQQPFNVETTEDAMLSIHRPNAGTPNATETPATATETTTEMTETATSPTGTTTGTETPTPNATETEGG